jgi:hypothetical protein
VRLFAAVLLGLASGLAQAQAPTDAKLPERPWRVVILNDADPTLPAFVIIDRAMRAALTAPEKHRVDIFSETLDMLRFPGAAIEDELVALLAKKHAGARVDAVVAIGASSLDFAEKHRARLWPGAHEHGLPHEQRPRRHRARRREGADARDHVAARRNALRRHPDRAPGGNLPAAARQAGGLARRLELVDAAVSHE